MGTLIRPDKGTDTRLRDVSTLQRTWALTVARLGVVISSMIALNTHWATSPSRPRPPNPS